MYDRDFETYEFISFHLIYIFLILKLLHNYVFIKIYYCYINEILKWSSFSKCLMGLWTKGPRKISQFK